MVEDVWLGSWLEDLPVVAAAGLATRTPCAEASPVEFSFSLSDPELTMTWTLTCKALVKDIISMKL